MEDTFLYPVLFKNSPLAWVFIRLMEKIGNMNEISQRKRDCATLPLCLPPHPPTAQFPCRQSLPKAMCRIGKAI
jgi:hypothetical protein